MYAIESQLAIIKQVAIVTKQVFLHVLQLKVVYAHNSSHVDTYNKYNEQLMITVSDVINTIHSYYH